MDKADIVREIDKVIEALEWAILKEERLSESFAAQHCSSKILYSPLVVKLNEAKDAMTRLASVLLDK